MRTLAKTRPGRGLELVSRPTPEPCPGEVLFADGRGEHPRDGLPRLQLGRDWAAENLVPPRILGHELAGTVAAAGAGVLTLWLQSTYTTNSATFNMRITC
jgi:NADPH:quinone reductase-like Zn-dependent oxidoreductase